MITITDGTTSLSPILDPEFDLEVEAGNVVHRIIDRAAPEVTYRPGGYAHGTMTLLVESLAAALAMKNLHTQPLPLALTDDALPEQSMTYAAAGRIRIQRTDGRKLYTVSIEFQEVPGA